MRRVTASVWASEETFGSCNGHVEIADVFVREKAGRYRLVGEVRRDQTEREQAQHDAAKTHQRRQEGMVAVARRVDRSIDHAVESGAVDLVFAEQQRRERRRERECVEQRDGDRAGDAQGELLVELPGRARERRDGDEDRQQHQRARDDRAGDLLHRRCRTGEGLHVLLVDESRDVLDDDDRVVDDQPGRKRQTEQRERVDREAERLHQREGADQRHGDRDGWDQRGAPALQEQEHDRDHQDDRDREGLEDLADRLAHERRRVEADLVGDAVREVALQAIHRGPHVARDLQRVSRWAR